MRWTVGEIKPSYRIRMAKFDFRDDAIEFAFNKSIHNPLSTFRVYDSRTGEMLDYQNGAEFKFEYPPID